MNECLKNELYLLEIEPDRFSKAKGYGRDGIFRVAACGIFGNRYLPFVAPILGCRRSAAVVVSCFVEWQNNHFLKIDKFSIL